MTSQKISQFNVSTTLSDSDLFTFVINGTNKSISYANFKIDLGVTGTLTQTGDPLGVPVLNSIGSDFTIRNLEPSKGMTFTISPEDGILGACNFVQDSGGLTIVENLNADVYNIRTIKAEAPLQVNIENNAIVIKTTDSPLAATNTVIVSTIADFPDAISGVITLVDDINYIIVQPITTASRFMLGNNNSITSRNPLSPLFTYTGTGTLFTGVDVNLTMHDIFINCSNGQVFDMSSTGSGNFLLLTLVIVQDCNKYGTFSDLRTVDITNSSAISSNDGITLSGVTNWNIFSLTKFSLITTSATFIGVDFGSSIHNTVELANFIVRGVTGSIGIKGLAASGNLAVDRLATVATSEFTGMLTPLSGISETDIRWNFQGNTPISDSISDGLIFSTSNALETTITTQGVAVKINAVFVTEAVSHFTSDVTGRLTYIGERSTRLPIDAVVTIVAAAGGDKQVLSCIAINGVVVEATCVQETASSTKAASLATVWQYDFQPNDFVEIFIENDSTTENLIATQVVLRIN